MKSKLLNDLARNLVGDGKKPNLFFVTSEGNIILVTSSFTIAYKEWCQLRHDVIMKESTLEDRRFGVICSVEPKEENSNQLIIIDNSTDFILQ